MTKFKVSYKYKLDDGDYAGICTVMAEIPLFVVPPNLPPKEEEIYKNAHEDYVSGIIRAEVVNKLPTNAELVSIESYQEIA